MRLIGSCCLTLAIGSSLFVLATARQTPSSQRADDTPAVIRADDFASLQAAIDAVPITGGTLELGPRIYTIDRPLLIRHEDFHLRGVGPASHIVNRNEAGEPAVIIEPPRGFVSKSGQKERLWRIQLSNFRVTGNDKSGHGIVARRLQEFFMEAVTVSDHGQDGVHCVDCYEDMRLSHCLITYNKGAGLFAKGNHDTIIANTQFEENEDAVRFVDGFNLCMTGNNLDDHLRHGVVVENTYGSVISGNMIEECQGWAVILDRDCYGITVSANVIAHEFTGGVDLQDAHGCTVSANSFPLCKQAGVRVGPDSDRIAITGNSFGDSYIGAGKNLRTRSTKIEADQNQSAGIVLEATKDLTITGNSFSGSMPYALTVNGECRHVIFSSNIVIGTKSQHEKLKDSVVQANIARQAE